MRLSANNKEKAMPDRPVHGHFLTIGQWVMGEMGQQIWVVTWVMWVPWPVNPFYIVVNSEQTMSAPSPIACDGNCVPKTWRIQIEYM